MKNISIWYNRFGVDECYFEMKGRWNKESLVEIGKEVDVCEGVDFELFEEEVRGEGWVMYGYERYRDWETDRKSVV